MPPAYSFYGKSNAGQLENCKTSERKKQTRAYFLLLFLSVMIDATPTYAMPRLRQSEQQQFTINGVKSYNSNGCGVGGERGVAHHHCCCCFFKRAISRSNLIAKITIKYETDRLAGRPTSRRTDGRRDREPGSRTTRRQPGSRQQP